MKAFDTSRFAPHAQLAGVRALVVDDDPDLVELTELLLSTYGMDVTVAHSGHEAFERFEESPPDIVISDVQMPDGDGIELIGRIRSLGPERGGLTPAIAMSGAGKLTETLDAGFHFHLTKPAQAQVLIDAIRSFRRDEPDGHGHWSLGTSDGVILMRWEGRITGADMRAMATALVPLLEATVERVHVISDVRRLDAVSPSVAAVAQVAIWDVRGKIESVAVIGGSTIVRAMSRGTCGVLGIPCAFHDEWPEEPTNVERRIE